MIIPYYSRIFKKSYKKLRNGQKITRNEVESVIGIIVSGENLPLKYQDHKLHGEYKRHRECHVKSDILLIYKTIDNVLLLVNIGTHSELF